ncbi:MAG: hypothetical protein NTW74_13235 [Acidobacteria bacterium]|nr:hypothetical protein [Acidobacteriota bacterium]
MSKYNTFFFISLLAYGQAQISNLAIHPTGNSVYFSTQLSPKGQSHPPALRLFELKDNRLTILDQSNPPGAFGARTFPSVLFSASASVRAINSTFNCTGGSSCLFISRAATAISSNGQLLNFSAFSSISPNGRFAALYSNAQASPTDPLPANSIRLLDLATGQITTLGKQPASSGQFVTDNGTTLTATNTGLQLIGPAQSKDLPLTRIASRLLLNNEATRIVYEVTDAPVEIRIIDIATGTDQTLFPGSKPTLALDGRTLTYLNANNQISIADLITRSTRPLISESEPILEQTISSNGTTVAAITKSGRILSINTTNSQVTQLLDAPPQPATLFTGMVPGSYNELTGSFPEDFIPNLKLSNQPDPFFLGRTAKGITFQIPWEAKPDEESVLSFNVKDSPWDSPILKSIRATSARILPTDDTSIAIHEDWSGPVTMNNPASLGETVHMFGTGYGPVDGTLESGKPTPTNRLFRMTSTCQWKAIPQFGNPQPLEVEFAGLAPGLTGIYQFNFKIPNNWDYSLFNPYCQFPDNSFLLTGAIPVRMP